MIRRAGAHIYDGLATSAAYVFGEGDFAEYAIEALTAFTLNDGNTDYEGRIDHAARTVTVFVPSAVTLSNLAPAITHDGLSLVSDPQNPDFSGPVTYTVTLEDGRKIPYTVRVSANIVTSVTELTALLSGAQGNTEDNPLPVKLSVNLADGTNGWTASLTAIYNYNNNANPKIYLDLDLSDCDMTGTEFDPGNAAGKAYITGLVLPDAAISINGGSNQYDVTFQNFTNLRTLSASGVETVGGYAFYNCTGLTELSLPAEKAIGPAEFYP